MKIRFLVIPVLFLLLAPINLLSQQTDASLLTVDSVFSYGTKSRGPVRWTADGTGYLALEPAPDKPGAVDLVRYDVQSGARTIKVSANKVVTGGPAYFIGVQLILAFPMYFATMIALGVLLALSGEVPQQKELEGVSVLLLFVVNGGMLLPCLIVALVCGKPENSERPWRRTLDDFDDD